MKQEFDENGNHRLVADDGTASRWVSYAAWSYLDGMVGVTDYYTGEGEKIMTPDEFCRLHGEA